MQFGATSMVLFSVACLAPGMVTVFLPVPFALLSRRIIG